MDLLRAFTIAGFAGSAIVIVAFFAAQQGWVDAKDHRFLLANLLGSALILLSLYAEWNFPAAVIEAFWAAISLYGLVRGPGRTSQH